MTDERKDCFAPWWRRLQDDPAGRAALRRCSDLVAVMMVPAFHELWRRARTSGFTNAERIAVAAAVLSHVRDDQADGRSFINVVGPLLSEARFRRAMTIDELEELLVTLVRFVRLGRGVAPVESLGRDIQWWGSATKQRWAFEYYEGMEAISR